MLRKMLMSRDGGLVLKLMLVFDDSDCIVAIEPDAMCYMTGLLSSQDGNNGGTVEVGYGRSAKGNLTRERDSATILAFYGNTIVQVAQ